MDEPLCLMDGLPVLECRGGGLSYLRQGVGRPVVLVHGSLADCRYWLPQLRGLSQDFLLYAPSLRHYWPRPWMADAERGFSLVRHAEDVAAFMDAVADGPVHLVGHSRGGQVALEVARRYPGRLATLVLADPVVPFAGSAADGMEASEPDPEREENRRRAIAWIAEGRVEEGLSLFVDTVMGAGTWRRLNERRRRMPLDNAMTLLGQHRDRPPLFAEGDLAALRMPVLLLNGQRSGAHYKATAVRLLGLLPNARIEVIEHAGHAMSAENHPAFNEALRHHFAS